MLIHLSKAMKESVIFIFAWPAVDGYTAIRIITEDNEIAWYINKI